VPSVWGWVWICVSTFLWRVTRLRNATRPCQKSSRAKRSGVHYLNTVACFLSPHHHHIHASKITFFSWTTGTDAIRLNQTAHAQPALLAHAVALWRVLQHELGMPVSTFASSVLGHSLGEYSAVCVAGGLSLFDAIRLVVRGESELVCRAASVYRQVCVCVT
jgi:malonyl CoA-acyl carrier protein transacylase